MKKYTMVSAPLGRSAELRQDVYLASDVDAEREKDRARIAELEQANKLLRDELNVDESVMTTDQAHIAELQKALSFWLPQVSATEHPLNDRIASDAYLLAGMQGELEPDAATLGWIELRSTLGKQSS